jgi:hypothetical protein
MRDSKSMRCVRQAGEYRVKIKYWLLMVAVIAGALGMSSYPSHAQIVPQGIEPEFIQQAQTVLIPITAINLESATPAQNLTESDFSLNVDGEPRPFQLSRPGAAETKDRPNLLIILPLGVPLDRKQVLDRTIADLSQQSQLGWNISILDDAGEQTPYIRDLKTTIAELQTMESNNPGDIALADWRVTAALAIASMRDLPGRRVVMTLGDIFH